MKATMIRVDTDDPQHDLVTVRLDDSLVLKGSIPKGGGVDYARNYLMPMLGLPITVVSQGVMKLIPFDPLQTMGEVDELLGGEVL